MSNQWTDIACLILLGIGSLLALSAAIGLVRFRYTMSRLHAVSKPQTLGLIVSILAVILRIHGLSGITPTQKGDLGIVALAMLFALLTTPVTASRLGRIALKEKLVDSSSLSRDDTAR